MFLSQCLLDGKAAVNPYDIHRHLWGLFPDMPNQNRPFIFRTDQRHKGQDAQILLQSEREPERASANIKVLKSKPVQLHLYPGQPLRFLLRANPVKCLKDERCRVPLIKEEALMDWLDRKLDGVGQVAKARILSRENLYFRKKGRPGKIVTVTFTGILAVDDPDRMRDLVRNGIGPAKAFGCGLMSLART